MKKFIKVLFVEDDPDQLFLFEKFFSLKGLATISATNSNEAFEMLEKDQPDIILLDIMLKNENGLDIMEKIKNDPMLSDIPIFVFTNADKKEFKERAEKLGAQAYIIKSETIPQEIAERIINFISKGK